MSHRRGRLQTAAEDSLNCFGLQLAPHYYGARTAQRAVVSGPMPSQVVSAGGLRYCSRLKRASKPECFSTRQSLLHDDG